MTDRTDMQIYEMVSADFARTLEREKAALLYAVKTAREFIRGRDLNYAMIAPELTQTLSECLDAAIAQSEGK